MEDAIQNVQTFFGLNLNFLYHLLSDFEHLGPHYCKQLV